jgi:GDP-L-fucose synthase
MDSSKIRALGWKPEITLDDGISSAYRRFLKKKAGNPYLGQDDVIA